MTVVAENYAVRVVIGGKALHNLTRSRVYHREAIADVLRHINELAARCDSDPGRIAGARALSGLRLSQFQFFGECRRPIFPRVNEKQIGVASGDIERVAVRRERRTVECAILQQCLGDLPALQIDNLNTLLAPAAEHHYSLITTESRYYIERHAAKLDCLTHSIKADAGR